MRKGLSPSFDSDEYDAEGVTFVTLVENDGYVVTLATFEAGASIGEHPAGVPQLFHVVSGRGWVSGADRDRVRISAGEHVVGETDERHASGTSGGMIAVIIQSKDPGSFSAALG
jgi:quercetin dioxygenase-like cupin family protein